MLPVWFILSIIWSVVTTVLYPIFWLVWGILYAPIRLVLGLSDFVGFVYNYIYELVRDIWLIVSGIFKLATNAEATVHTYEVSIWRSLWNDLFSQVFRAVRSILNGFVAFFAACNRHRLSIYNHLQKLIRTLNQPPQRSQPVESSHQSQQSGSQILMMTLISKEAMMTVKPYGRGSSAATVGKPLVHPAAVDLRGKVYELLRQNATRFLMDDIYRNPGPLQFEGPGADSKAVSLCVEDLDYMGRIKELNDYLDKVRTIVKPGCSQDVLKAALSAMSSVTDILSVMTSQRE